MVERRYGGTTTPHFTLKLSRVSGDTFRRQTDICGWKDTQSTCPNKRLAGEIDDFCNGTAQDNDCRINDQCSHDGIFAAIPG